MFVSDPAAFVSCASGVFHLRAKFEIGFEMNFSGVMPCRTGGIVDSSDKNTLARQG